MRGQEGGGGGVGRGRGGPSGVRKLQGGGHKEWLASRPALGIGQLVHYLFIISSPAFPLNYAASDYSYPYPPL